MKQKIYTTGELISEIREKLFGTDYEAFISQLVRTNTHSRYVNGRVSARQVRRWEEDDGNDISLDLAEDLADIEGITLNDIRALLGRTTRPKKTEPYGVTPKGEWGDIQPFIKGVPESAKLHRTGLVTYAARIARVGGQHDDAFGGFDSGRVMAFDAGAYVWAGRIALHQASELMILGEPSRAADLLGEGRSLLNRQLEIARTSVDFQTVALIQRVLARGQEFEGYIWWARTDYMKVIPAAETLLELGENFKDYQLAARVAHLLARVYIGLGMPNKALQYAEAGFKYTKLLSNPEYSSRVLLLDYPPDNGLLYRMDQAYAVLLDAYVAAGDFVNARRVRNRISPEADLLHGTYCYSLLPYLWMEYLSTHSCSQPTEIAIAEIDETYAKWDKALASSGNRYVRIIINRDYGVILRQCRRFREAQQVLETAYRLAVTHSSRARQLDIAIELSLVRSQQGNKELALRSLNMIQSAIQNTDNPGLQTKFHQAIEAVATSQSPTLAFL